MASVLSRLYLQTSRKFWINYRSIYSTTVKFLPLLQFKLSDIGEGIAEVQIKEWHVKVGDRVAEFDNICEVQSDKASVTITSRYEGIIKKLYYEVDDIAKVGKPLMDIETDHISEAGTVEVVSDSAIIKSENVDKNDDIRKVFAAKSLAAPAVRRIARDHKIDLRDIHGTGKDGRILKQDILSYVNIADVTETHKEIPSERVISKPDLEHMIYQIGEDRSVPVRGYTRAMMKTMSEALKIPHFGFYDEINVDRLIEVRERLRDAGKNKGIKMTYMPIFIKAASLALNNYPILNSRLDANMENIIYQTSHNISVAIDSPGGLVVPNIKNCEQRNLWEIAVELIRLQEFSKKQQLSKTDLSNGTFTLSNIGTIGGTYMSPVIFPPQVAIGAIGRIERVPRFDRSGQVHAANILKISWCADHRIIDGATMARFSGMYKEYIENPSTMIADLR